MKKQWKYSIEMGEAYRKLHAQCGIEKGDSVKLLRLFGDHEMGFGHICGSAADASVGSVYEVSNNDGHTIQLSNRYHYPFFVLEVVKKAIQPITVKLNSEHNAVVSKDGVVVGCQTFTLAKIDELVAAVAEVRKQSTT